MIALIDVLALMEEIDPYGKPVPFSITFITCDQSRGTGGEIITIPHAVRTDKHKEARQEAQQRTGPRPLNLKRQYRNIRVCGTTQIRKVNIRLITRFNEQKVFY